MIKDGVAAGFRTPKPECLDVFFLNNKTILTSNYHYLNNVFVREYICNCVQLTSDI